MSKDTGRPNERESCGSLVGLIMGSKSDWEIMRHGAATLDELRVPYDVRVLSAHRTPDALAEYVTRSAEGTIQVFIAAAGGAAHLAGAVAARTHLPVLGVPIPLEPLNGLDALLSTVQMPGGIPVGTLGIGRAGAINAALLATGILALNNATCREALIQYRQAQSARVLAQPDPRVPA